MRSDVSMNDVKNQNQNQNQPAQQLKSVFLEAVAWHDIPPGVKRKLFTVYHVCWGQLFFSTTWHLGPSLCSRTFCNIPSCMSVYLTM